LQAPPPPPPPPPLKRVHSSWVAEGQLCISSERWLACCATLRLCSPLVAHAAFAQVARAPHVPLTADRFWEALWFAHVRARSETPLAARLSHEWEYDEEEVMSAVMATLLPLTYNLDAATAVGSAQRAAAAVRRERAAAQAQDEAAGLGAFAGALGGGGASAAARLGGGGGGGGGGAGGGGAGGGGGGGGVGAKGSWCGGGGGGGGVGGGGMQPSASVPQLGSIRSWAAADSTPLRLLDVSASDSNLAAPPRTAYQPPPQRSEYQPPQGRGAGAGAGGGGGARPGSAMPSHRARPISAPAHRQPPPPPSGLLVVGGAPSPPPPMPPPPMPPPPPPPAVARASQAEADWAKAAFPQAPMQMATSASMSSLAAAQAGVAGVAAAMAPRAPLQPHRAAPPLPIAPPKSSLGHDEGTQSYVRHMRKVWRTLDAQAVAAESAPDTHSSSAIALGLTRNGPARAGDISMVYRPQSMAALVQHRKVAATPTLNTDAYLEHYAAKLEAQRPAPKLKKGKKKGVKRKK